MTILQEFKKKQKEKVFYLPCDPELRKWSLFIIQEYNR